MRILLCLAFLIVSSAAYARSDGNERIICSHMKRINQDALPPADYVAGVDVHGRPVAPADINNGSNPLLENPIIIPVELDLAQKFGLALPMGIALKPEIMQIKIFPDGTVKYNTQDVTKNVQNTCIQYAGENPENSDESHGQGDTDTLPSDDQIQGQYPDYNYNE